MDKLILNPRITTKGDGANLSYIKEVKTTVEAFREHTEKDYHRVMLTYNEKNIPDGRTLLH